ncbi:MAG TPA: two-component sensor histidine kinase [Clostridiales bacterium]|nr:two-component sensor histidine kinase [Clostridiales bacterium]
MKGLTVRQRVVFWYTAMLVLIAVAVFVILHFSSARHAVTYVEETLHTAAIYAVDEIEIDDGVIDLDDDLDDIDYANVMVYDGDGIVLLYGRIPEFDLPLMEGGVREAPGDTGNMWYVYDTYCPLTSSVAVWVRTCMALDSVQSVESYAVTVFLWMIIPLSLLAGLGGYLITRRAFAPMVRITDTARGIAGGGDLTKRMNLSGQKDEFGQLADTFDQMFARLHAAFEQQKRFVSDASHELRTPLSVIHAQCDYALTRGEEAEKTRAIETIKRQAGRMTGLVNRLLLLSRMDSGTQDIQKEPVDLSALLESVSVELAPVAAERGITLQKEIEPNVSVCADELLLIRMVMNLVENAIRFGKSGGFVRLTLQTEPGRIKGTVEDDGVGISETDLPHIWDRFFQADAARSESGSSGLGLPIVRQIIELHGGSVSAQSSPGVGTTVTFYLPTGED